MWNSGGALVGVRRAGADDQGGRNTDRHEERPVRLSDTVGCERVGHRVQARPTRALERNSRNRLVYASLPRAERMASRTMKKWMMRITVESCWNCGDHAAAVAWHIDHIGRRGAFCIETRVFPYLGIAAFKVVVYTPNGNITLRADGKEVQTRWIVTGIRTLPKQNWCE